MQAKVRYLPPHRREGVTLKNIAVERPNAARTMAPHSIFAQTNPIIQPGVYEEYFSFNGGSGGIMQPPTGVNGNWGQQIQQVLQVLQQVLQVPQQAPQVLQRIQQVPQQLFMQATTLPDLGVIKEVVQELYGPSLRQIGFPEFYKPYP